MMESVKKMVLEHKDEPYILWKAQLQLTQLLSDKRVILLSSSKCGFIFNSYNPSSPAASAKLPYEADNEKTGASHFFSDLVLMGYFVFLLQDARWIPS